MKKIKVIVLISLIGFVFTLGLAIWTGVSAFKYFSAKTHQFIDSPAVQNSLKTAKSQTQGFSKIQALNCWQKTQALVAVEPWLVRPALENLKNLKLECFEKKPVICEGFDCSQKKDLIHTAAGDVI